MYCCCSVLLVIAVAIFATDGNGTEQGQDYQCALEIARNIKKVLHSVRYVDRYNGTRKAVMSACCGKKYFNRTADLLGVSFVFVVVLLAGAPSD